MRALNTLREIELFSEAKVKSKLLVAKINPLEEEYKKQTESMLEGLMFDYWLSSDESVLCRYIELDEAHKFLHRRTARYLSLFALSLEQYALSADMSRLVLRHHTTASSGSSARSSSSRFDGGVWVQRAQIGRAHV